MESITGLLAQLVKVVSGQKAGRKRLRDQGPGDFPAEWGTQEDDEDMGSSLGED
jgi:hypothetical protein